MTIISRLESNNWKSIGVSEVSVDLARQIRQGAIATRKPPVQLVARIQCILVDGGLYTDDAFVKAVKAKV